MSWYVDDEAAAPVRLGVPTPVRGWPIYTVLGLSGVGVAVAAVLRSYFPSLAAYLVLLAAGCVLLFYHRRLAIIATRRAGGSGYLAVHGLERGAIAALTCACLANGIVIAFEIASWDWGS